MNGNGSSKGGPSELLNGLEQASDMSILKNIYASAANPTAMFPDIPSPSGNKPELIGGAQPAWRQRVADQFVVRRQSPNSIAEHRNQIKKKTGVKMPVRLPTLPKVEHESDNKTVQNNNNKRSPDPASPRDDQKKKAKKPKSNKANIIYQLAPPDLEELYSVHGSEDKLSIELFDWDERDKTSNEWVELGKTKYEGKGTPARALFFENREWTWTRCRVLSFSMDTADPIGNFVITFENDEQGKPLLKKAKRLSLLFDDEKEENFKQRVERCKEMRDSALAIRRYTSYVKLQSDTLFSPIQQSALHGIVEKLMRNVRKLVIFRQKSVEQLLLEVRAEYAMAMKQAIVDKARADPNEATKMEDLGLPDLPPKAAAPLKALVALLTPEEMAILGLVDSTAILKEPLARTVSHITQLHFTRNPGSTAVVLALYKSWATVKQQYFLRTNDLKLPMGLFEYQDFQENQFLTVLERLNMDWRSLGVNQIRDSLSSVFPLFVNSQSEFHSSDLKKFLNMITFMLREQLAVMIIESLNHFLHHFNQYSKPQALRVETEKSIESTKEEEEEELSMAQKGSMTPKDKMAYLAQVRATMAQAAGDAASERIAPGEARAMILKYLKPNATLLCELDPGRLATSDDFVYPLFVFKLATHDRQVVFQPELVEVETTLMRLLSIPSKLHILSQIENEVVPLLGLGELPLCTNTTMPRCFLHAAKIKKQAKVIIRNNLRQPLALRALYKDYADRLNFETAEYVKKWFPLPEELKAIREEDKKRLDDAKARANAKGGQSFEEEDQHLEQEFDDSVDPEALAAAEAARANANASTADAPDELHSLEETTAEIAKFLRYAQEIQDLSPTHVTFRLIKIECNLVKEQLAEKARNIAHKLMEGLCEVARQQSNDMKNDFERILDRLGRKSHNVKQLAELQEFVAAVDRQHIPRLKREIKTLLNRLQVLYDINYGVPTEDQDISWKLQTRPQRVTEALNDARDQIGQDNQLFQQELSEEQSQFAEDLREYSKKIEGFADLEIGNKTRTEEEWSEVERLQEALNIAEERVKSFNERDVLFGGTPTEYSDLKALKEQVEPFVKLWRTAAFFETDHTKWMEDKFSEQDPVDISKKVTEWGKLMVRLEKEFAAGQSEIASSVAAHYLAKINAFKKHLPVIEALRAPGLQDRHWQAISALICPDNKEMFKDPKEFHLGRLIQYDANKYRVELDEIAVRASKEHSLQQQLSKMESEWVNVNMELELYKNTGCSILKNSEDILTLLDDHTLRTQSMRGSPYITEIEKDVKKWEKKLMDTSKILEEWLACQKTWIYLEPIFGSEDIMRQMPKEGSKFRKVDEIWRSIIKAAVGQLNALDFMSETDKLHEKFVKCNQDLDIIGKGLNEYLETKRLAFPRFYFLSNDELLSILSQTKNAEAVQPHLNKCFDALKSLKFEDVGGKKCIKGMFSEEGEYVPFHVTVFPDEGPKKGNVELWLKEVEMVIFECVKRCTRNAIGTFAQKARDKWIMEEPGQVVLSVSQLYFTRQVTKALADQGNQGLKNYLDKVIKANLAKLVELVRGKLPKLIRQTLKALVVVDVHARDVITRICNAGIDRADDFEWLAQLRYYWEGGHGKDAVPGLGPTGLEHEVDPTKAPDKDGFIVADGVLNVRIVNAHQHYGYEYLGNSDRLVITPLTDRCYRTLMGAVHLHLGGAPEGPAGTGKTETVKDLSKALAIQCIVFNCSDGLNFRAMAKMFKGLAASGAWACFDEFNRIELEVLSVVAQQIGTIQRNIVEGNHSFFFDDVQLPLVHTCSAFITMNPGYAGRAELPDNLKALFRTVAMMIPDYALIAEIVLYSFGYADASNLARKTVTGLRLSSEQLSSQHHYDFGMRTLFAILAAAGTFKLAYPQQVEGSLCLRAMRDCNVPKFVSADLPLFAGILKDLFPGVDPVESDRTILLSAMRTAATSLNYQPTPPFIQKVVELFDTFCVRHGLMVVGAAFSGKSSNLKTLAKAVASLKGQEGDAAFEDVHPFVLNPKSITLNQMYGADDPNTKEWKDGVLGVLMRQCIGLPTEKWKWVVFDGPVDAIWIENMNTVLDNNKKLCLASGEQIKLVNLHTMVFEVEDLSVASPATVSRCGMVFMEPSQLGWRPVYDSWLNTVKADKKFAKLEEKYINEITDLVEWLVPPCLEFVRKNCSATIPTQAIHQVVSLTRMLGSMLAAMCKKDPLPKGDFLQHLESCMLFSLVWSLGCGTNTAGRVGFSNFLLELTTGLTEGKKKIDERYKERKAKLPFPIAIKAGEPAAKQVFDFLYQPDTGQWTSWMETRPAFQIPEGSMFHEMIVPSLETISASWVLETLVRNAHHVLLAGDTGTGKSVIVLQKLLIDLKKSVYIPIMLGFSARTSANQTQDIIDGKLDRRRMGVFGPPPGRRAIVFVDDLNMPMKETYFAQPPIELLRQWLDHGGWYDRELNSFKKLVDIQFMAAMGPPGGGRNEITYRMSRHFHSICLNPYQDSSLATIFGTILGFSLKKFTGKVSALRKNVVEATVELYSNVTAKLLPTPAKSHYTFNLRDVSKVFQGLTGASSDHVKEGVDIMRCWIHEASRVFADRLINEGDAEIFNGIVNDMLKKHFQTSRENVIGKGEDGKIAPLIFTNFADTRDLKKPYKQCEDIPELTNVVYAALDEYNVNNEKSRMNLVMFTAAIEHISRISRCINTTFGNALLVGVGGSGRQSLSRLAAYISEVDVFQIEITKGYGQAEWRESLKEMFTQAGTKTSSLVFLFTDSQIKSEGFVEDINNILNNGEVPNLFLPEDKLPILDACAKDAGAAGQGDDVFGFFIQRCRKNLHLVLCFSPIGDAFSTRLRMFPALVNCCTIDWFHPWPTDALKNVATSFFKELEIEPKIKEGVVAVCVDMQERVKNATEEYFRVMRRYNYVTPTSYLELIKIFLKLFNVKRDDIAGAQARYVNGLDKLADTERQVTTMKLELEALQPQLIQSSKETNELIIVVQGETEKADARAAIVSKDEAQCNAQAQQANAIKAECEAGLAEAMPVLNDAMKALSVVKKAQIDELKAMKVPTAGVLLVIEALCIMMGVPPAKVGEVGKKTDDYWEPAKKKLLGDPKLMNRIETYDKDNIAPDKIKKVRPYVQNPNFAPDQIRKASMAAEGFCRWITAMEKYDTVAKEIAPKRAALAEAEGALASAMASLAIKQAELKEVMDKLATLNAKLAEANQTKADLENKVTTCANRLEAAEQLMKGLSGERGRWGEKAKALALDLQNVVGDILLSSGVIAYLGVFVSEFRTSCVQAWVAKLKEKGIKCDASYRLNKVLGNAVRIREWGIDGLPNDDFSIDNAIILANSLRWGLLIDPQMQANKWVKNMEEKNNLQIIKQTDDKFMRVLQSAVSLGQPVLIEALGEALEPLLEPILLKNTFKSGSRDMMIIGADSVEYSQDFRLYMTTKLSNPHYPPEASTKVTLINFMVTVTGLEDQMLNRVVAAEHPKLEADRNELIVESADNEKQLANIEDTILRQLKDSKGNILDDKELIATLARSKEASKLIEKKVEKASKTKETIEKTRNDYKTLAYMTSVMFFCISDLANVDPMYQYSLEWFVILFLKAVKDADNAKDVTVRTANIEQTFMFSLFNNVCRSLFEKDKLFFAFHMCIRVLQARGKMEPSELRYLLTGVAGPVGREFPPNPCDDFDFGEHQEVDESLAGKWLPQQNWEQVSNLSHVPAFKGFEEAFVAKQKQWRTYYESPDPMSVTLPSPWEKDLSPFQKLCIMRALRPDKMVGAVRDCVSVCLGEKYTQPPPFDLPTAFADSSSTAPLIFVLSSGVDPTKHVFKMAGEMGYTGDRLFSISLGQGQGIYAENAIKEAVEKGTWVLLQNCHLLVSWLPTLQRLVEEMNPESVNSDFRLWLTSMPSPHFPVPVLQNGVKMTNEPPKGIRANMMETFRSEKDAWYNESSKPDRLRKMFFGLAMFHAVVLERRKFGPMGWNIKYQWTVGDRDISRTQLKIYLDMYEEIPVVALRYLFGELNYGGRVTDEFDTRAVKFILSDFVAEGLGSAGYKFDEAGKYVMPGDCQTLDDYRKAISGLPDEDSADVFGLHENVNISAALSDTSALFETLLSVQPRTSGGGAGASRDDVVAALAQDLEHRLPGLFDIEDAEEKYRVVYANSMNTVLVQELLRFNRLIAVVKKSLSDVQKALKGEVVMSGELEDMANSMYIGKVPKMWHRVAYPSLKPFASWATDLIQRLDFYARWIAEGAPGNFWISGLFFTQSFITGTMQNYARKYQIAIDVLDYDFQIMPDIPSDCKKGPEDGCYIYGLFLDGARFKDGILCDPMKRQLNSIMPTIWMKPMKQDLIPTNRMEYDCPLYKTSERFGALSTTGRSTNFVCTVKIPSKHPQKYWVKRGVALLTQKELA